MKTLTIIGRRWFQRGPGNTYHSAQVLIDGVPVLNTGIHYGYGDSYVDTAWSALEVAGKVASCDKERVDDWPRGTWPVGVPAPRIQYANGGREALWQWAERTGVVVHCEVSDVARERDLK